MDQSSQVRVVCPQCGKGYRWRDDFAGKQLQCRCGEAFTPPATQTQNKPMTGRALSGAYAQMASMHHSVSQSLEDRVDEAKAPRLSEIYLPAIILPVGAVVALGMCVNFSGSWTTAILAELLALSLQAFVFVPALVVSVFLVAQWFELGMGSLFSGLWKIAALTFGPGAVADVLFAATMAMAEFDWELLIAGFGYYLILCSAPLCIMFSISLYEAAMLLALTFIPRVGILYTVATLWPDLFA